jgi:hypothetical protein
VLGADHSSRGVTPTVMRRCVCSRNLVHEETLARIGSQRHRAEKGVTKNYATFFSCTSCFIVVILFSETFAAIFVQSNYRN